MGSNGGDTETSTISEDDATLDGRTVRRTRNIDAVLDAVIALAADGQFDPTAEEIAERAGVSHRSIYRYFDSRSELLEAAIARSTESIAPVLFFDDVGKGSLDERIARFVAARVETYRAFGPVARSAFGLRHETVRAGIESSRETLREQLVAHFAPELARLEERERSVVIGLVDAPFQFESMEYLTRSVCLTHDELTVALNRHLTMYFGALTGDSHSQTHA